MPPVVHVGDRDFTQIPITCVQSRTFIVPDRPGRLRRLLFLYLFVVVVIEY